MLWITGGIVVLILIVLAACAVGAFVAEVDRAGAEALRLATVEEDHDHDPYFDDVDEEPFELACYWCGATDHVGSSAEADANGWRQIDRYLHGKPIGTLSACPACINGPVKAGNPEAA